MPREPQRLSWEVAVRIRETKDHVGGERTWGPFDSREMAEAMAIALAPRSDITGCEVRTVERKEAS